MVRSTACHNLNPVQLRRPLPIEALGGKNWTETFCAAGLVVPNQSAKEDGEIGDSDMLLGLGPYCYASTGTELCSRERIFGWCRKSSSKQAGKGVKHNLGFIIVHVGAS